MLPRNQKGCSSQSSLHAIKRCICIYKERKGQPKFVALLIKEIEKTTVNEWKNDDSDILGALSSVYEKKLGQISLQY